jgi:hypothetical protein
LKRTPPLGSRVGNFLPLGIETPREEKYVRPSVSAKEKEEESALPDLRSVEGRICENSEADGQLTAALRHDGEGRNVVLGGAGPRKRKKRRASDKCVTRGGSST